MKNLIASVLAIIRVLALAACEVEIRNPEEPSSESENLSPEDMTAEELAEYVGYLSFETISELGYYPQWMQPHTYIVYDENCVPTIIEGGELTPEDLVGRDDIISIGFDHSIKAEPNTKAEYDLHGFIQNIYYLWPDGNYNLAPYQNTEDSEGQPAAEPVPSVVYEHMTLEEMTEAGYYSQWMPQGTEIIYDENKKATIIEGREFTPEEIEGRDDIASLGFFRRSKDYIIMPNTKAEYGPHDFIQNIYYLWPDGNYNLSPYSKTENAEITYYADITEYEQEKGKTVAMNENQCHSVYWLTNGMIAGAKETSEPMAFPRYKITFTYIGEEHCVYIGANNIFTSTLLGNGNYICTADRYNYTAAEELFKEAE